MTVIIRPALGSWSECYAPVGFITRLVGGTRSTNCWIWCRKTLHGAGCGCCSIKLPPRLAKQEQRAQLPNCAALIW